MAIMDVQNQRDDIIEPDIPLLVKGCEQLMNTFNTKKRDYPEIHAQLEVLRLMLKSLKEKFKDEVAIKKILMVSLPIMTTAKDIQCIKEASSLFLDLYGAFPGLPQLVNGDSDFNGHVMNLGDRLFKLGDYECQIKVVQCMLTVTIPQYFSLWTETWFMYKGDNLTAMFGNIQNNFDVLSRKFLNGVNHSLYGRSVHSVKARKAYIDAIQLLKVPNLDLWVDFNFGSKSISFYCFIPQFFGGEQEYWDCITITKSMVDSISIKPVIVNDENTLTAMLKLNCSCLHHISDDYASDEPAGRVITFSFWRFTSFCANLRKVFEKDRTSHRSHRTNATSKSNRK